MTPADQERWFLCLECGRAWRAEAWRRSGSACPSSAGSWPEFHPHIGWSHVARQLGVDEPEEGRRYRISLPIAAVA